MLSGFVGNIDKIATTPDEDAEFEADQFVARIMAAHKHTGQINDQYVALTIEQYLISKYTDRDKVDEALKSQFQAFAQLLIPEIDHMLGRINRKPEAEFDEDEAERFNQKIKSLIYGDEAK